MPILEYMRLLFKEWQALVTGSILAVLLAVQPYTRWPAPTRWIFWTCLILAGYVGAYRVWKRTWNELSEHKEVNESLQSSEPPQISLWASWPDDNAVNRPTTINVRNEGRVAIARVVVRRLQLGLYTVIFEPVSNLNPDEDRVIPYTISGSYAGTSDDLLDALTILRPSEIAPTPFGFTIDATKKNGQVRSLRFLLTYAPLHNPIRDPSAIETERCLTFENGS